MLRSTLPFDSFCADCAIAGTPRGDRWPHDYLRYLGNLLRNARMDKLLASSMTMASDIKSLDADMQVGGTDLALSGQVYGVPPGTKLPLGLWTRLILQYWRMCAAAGVRELQSLHHGNGHHPGPEGRHRWHQHQHGAAAGHIRCAVGTS